MKWRINVYRRPQRIPFQDTHIFLTPGRPQILDDSIDQEKEVLEHLRKCDQIEIGPVRDEKPLRSMKLVELRALANSKGVDFSETDSRMTIMKKLKE